MRHLNPLTLAWLAAFLIALVALALLAEQGARMDDARAPAATVQ